MKKNRVLYIFFTLLIFATLSGTGYSSPFDSLDPIEKGLSGKRQENEPLKLSDRFQEILHRAGTTFGTYLPQECFSTSIARFLKKNTYLPQEIKGNVRQWLKMARSDKFDVVTFWDKVYNCDDFCVAVISELLDCYLTSIEESYAGIILFDWANSNFEDSLKGGPWSNMMTYNNLQMANRVVQEMMNNHDSKLIIHARASKFGNKMAERKRADARGESVKNKFINMGISEDRIIVVSFGWEPPQINESVAQTHISRSTASNLHDEYKKFSKTAINQSALLYFSKNNNK